MEYEIEIYDIDVKTKNWKWLDDQSLSFIPRNGDFINVGRHNYEIIRVLINNKNSIRLFINTKYDFKDGE